MEFLFVVEMLTAYGATPKASEPHMCVVPIFDR